MSLETEKVGVAISPDERVETETEENRTGRERMLNKHPKKAGEKPADT